MEEGFCSESSRTKAVGGSSLFWVVAGGRVDVGRRDGLGREHRRVDGGEADDLRRGSGRSKNFGGSLKKGRRKTLVRFRFEPREREVRGAGRTMTAC